MSGTGSTGRGPQANVTDKGAGVVIDSFQGMRLLHLVGKAGPRATSKSNREEPRARVDAVFVAQISKCSAMHRSDIWMRYPARNPGTKES